MHSSTRQKVGLPSLMCNWRRGAQRSTPQSTERRHTRTDSSTLTLPPSQGQERHHPVSKAQSREGVWWQHKVVGDRTPETSVQGQWVSWGCDQGKPTPSHSPQTSETPPKLLLLPYVPVLTERIERVLGSEDCLQVQKHCQKRLVHVKQPSEDRKKKGVVYEVPSVSVCTPGTAGVIEFTSSGLVKVMPHYLDLTWLQEIQDNLHLSCTFPLQDRVRFLQNFLDICCMQFMSNFLHLSLAH